MHEGYVVALVQTSSDPEDLAEHLYTDYALMAADGRPPRSLDEALQGKNGVQWQKALEYEIVQLEKLGTWVIENLPKSQTVIPCMEVLKENKGQRVRLNRSEYALLLEGTSRLKG